MATQNLDGTVQGYNKRWRDPLDFYPTKRSRTDNGLSAIFNSNQEWWSPKLHAFSQIQPLSQPSTFNGNTVDFRIIKGSVGLLKNLEIQFKVTETGGSNPIQLVQPFFFVQWIEFWCNGGNDLIQRLYPVQMLFHFGAFFTQEQQERLAEFNNNFANDNAASGNFGYWGEEVIPASGTATYTMPLLGNFFAMCDGVFFPGLQDDFIVRVWLASNVLKGPGPVYTTVTAGTVGLTNMTLNILHEAWDSATQNKELGTYRQNVIHKDYLDTLRYTNSIAFTKGTASSWQLSPFIGLCPYIVVTFRASNSSPTADAWTTFFPLGNTNLGTLIEIDDAVGTDITGSTPMPSDWVLGSNSVRHFPGAMTATVPLYPIVFGEPVGAEIRTDHNGFIRFTGQEYIRITPASTSTAEVGELWTMQVVATGGAATSPTSGTWQLGMFGKVSTVFTYNHALTGASSVQTAVNVMLQYTQGANGQPIICTVGGTTFSGATTGITFTFTNMKKSQVPSLNGEGPTIVMSDLIASSANLFPLAVLTTPGAAAIGFALLASASPVTLNLDIFARTYRSVNIRQGRFELLKLI